MAITVTRAATEPAATEKDALEEPASTLTDEGVPNALLLSEIDIVICFSAIRFMLTVHVPMAPKTRLVGHCSDERASGGARIREVVWELPPSRAVTTAVWMVLTVPAVALKVALVVAAATLTEAGTVSRELLSLSATAVLAGAG